MTELPEWAEAMVRSTEVAQGAARGGDVRWHSNDPGAEPLSHARVLFVDAPDDLPVVEGSRVWSLWFDADPSRALDLTCKVPSGDPEVIAHELCVCTAVRWGELRVTAEGREHALPLDAEHLVRRALLRGSETAAGEAIDCGVLQVFQWSLGDGATVVAAVELVGRCAATDFDPWRVLLAARLVPTVRVGASVALTSCEAAVTWERPEGTQMVGCTADQEGRWRASISPRFETSLVRCANDRREARVPRWDVAFDAVSLDVREASFVAADPSRPREPPALDVAVRRGLRGDHGAPALLVEDAAVWADDGQGDFDGAVIAPSLRGDELLADALRAWRLDPVVPLPLSDRDALHVVWRWGAADPRWRVTHAMRCELRGATLRLTAGAPVAAGEWATFFAHGAAFGLSLDHRPEGALSRALRDIESTHPPLPPGSTMPAAASWWTLWNLRFASTAVYGPHERLQALPPIRVSELLRALLDDDASAAARVLHPEVVLTRADGTVGRGATAVIEGVRAGRYEVIDAEVDALTVALSSADLPVTLRFRLRGEASRGRLTAIEVTLLDAG